MGTKPDERIVSMVNRLNLMGAPVEQAMQEASTRSMGGSPFADALRSVAEDYAQGLWPSELTGGTTVWGESWAHCAFCEEDFLPDGHDALYCSTSCHEHDAGLDN
jgi:hypothetical protein